MATFAARPIFFEGQVLAASDLGSIGDSGRARDERHVIYEHRAGIVNGLTLSAVDDKDANGTPYKRVFVAPGLAYDDLGREILLDEKFEIFSARFAQTIGASADATSFYPVMLRSDYRTRPPQAGGMGLCNTTAATRIDESLDISVGRPETVSPDSAALATPAPDPSPSEGVGPALLLGFVQWDPATSQFSGVFDEVPGMKRRYAGINAATVAGMSDSLLLQPGSKADLGSLAVELDGAKGELRFGAIGADTLVGDDALFKVDKDGNLSAKGTISGRAAPGTTLFSAGTASDGLILPLPVGVTDDQVTGGTATLQIIVSPNIDPASSPDPTKPWAALTQECRVDSDRRLHCRIAWMSLDFTGGQQGTEVVSGPGAASYLIAASIAGAAK